MRWFYLPNFLGISTSISPDDSCAQLPGLQPVQTPSHHLIISVHTLLLYFLIIDKRRCIRKCKCLANACVQSNVCQYHQSRRKLMYDFDIYSFDAWTPIDTSRWCSDRWVQQVHRPWSALTSCIKCWAQMIWIKNLDVQIGKTVTNTAMFSV